MSKQEKTRKIRELDQKLSRLREQQHKLDIEARKWASKRGKVNEQIKNLRAEILELKNKRDGLNENVKELKKLREQTRTEIHEKIEEMKKLDQEIKVLNKKRPSRSPQVLKKESEGIEWKIQTTPLSLEEEKELVERVKKLEIQLNVHRKIEQFYQKTFELRTELKALETKRKLCHEKLTENAQRSQEFHERMLEEIEKVKELRIKANELHEEFVQARERARLIQKEIMGVLSQIKMLQGEVHKEEEKEKRKSENAIRKKFEKQAREKLKRGEKLTWEEFRILAEKGMATQD